MDLRYQELEKAVAEAVTATDTAFGDAVAVREGIVWTEYVLGHGFDLLRLAGRRRPEGGWPSHSVCESQGTATVELTSSPLYGIAALLAELAKSAGSDGLRAIETYGGFGGWIAPYIAFLLSRAEHHAAVFWRPATPQGEGDAPATLVMAAAAAKGQKVPPMLIAPGAAYGARERDKLLVGQVPTPLVNRLRAAAQGRLQQNLLCIVSRSAARDTDLTDFISVGDAILSFGLATRAPELLNVESLLEHSKLA
jgi:hypothetical protein